MKIYLRGKVVLLAIALLAFTALSQTADDDEVDTSIPGYPYKIYSGMADLIQDISISMLSRASKRFIMHSSLHKEILLMIRCLYGFLELLDAPLYWHASTKLDLLSSILARLLLL